jgi:hypothetical protein
VATRDAPERRARTTPTARAEVARNDITARVSSSTRRVGVREARQTERLRRTGRYVPARRTCLDTSPAIASILDGTSMTPLQLSSRVFEDARSRTRLLQRGEFREALLPDGPDLVVYDDGTVITADWTVTETAPLVLRYSLVRSTLRKSIISSPLPQTPGSSRRRRHHRRRHKSPTHRGQGRHHSERGRPHPRHRRLEVDGPFDDPFRTALRQFVDTIEAVAVPATAVRRPRSSSQRHRDRHVR